MSCAGYIAIAFNAGWWLGGIAVMADRRRARRRPARQPKGEGKWPVRCL